MSWGRRFEVADWQRQQAKFAPRLDAVATDGCKASVTTFVPQVPLLLKKRSFTLILPWPPTTNHSHYGNHHLTDETRKFRAVVAALCLDQRIQPLSGRLALSIICYQSDNRLRDIGNLEKQTSDALVFAGVIRDENIDQIEVHRVRLSDDKNSITVTVREF